MVHVGHVHHYIKFGSANLVCLFSEQIATMVVSGTQMLTTGTIEPHWILDIVFILIKYDIILFSFQCWHAIKTWLLYYFLWVYADSYFLSCEHYTLFTYIKEVELLYISCLGRVRNKGITWSAQCKICLEYPKKVRYIKLWVMLKYPFSLRVSSINIVNNLTKPYLVQCKVHSRAIWSQVFCPSPHTECQQTKRVHLD